MSFDSLSVIQTHIILYFHHYVQEIKQQERIKICTLSRQISSVRPCFKDIRWFRSFIQKSNDKEKSLLKIVSLRLLSTMNFRRSKCIRIFRWFKSHLDNFILNTLNCVTFIWILLNKLLHPNFNILCAGQKAKFKMVFETVIIIFLQKIFSFS